MLRSLASAAGGRDAEKASVVCCREHRTELATLDSLDWDALAEAATSLPPAQPLPPPPNRSLLLSLHDQLAQRERDLDRKGETRTRKVVLGPDKHFSRSTSLDHLAPCDLSCRDLQLDAPNTRCLLVVRVIARPVRTASVQLVVEDAQGRAVPVSIFHVPARFGQDELDDLWPVGAIFGVKEPLFRSLRVGYHLRIEAPSDLVRLYPPSPHLHNFNFPSHPSHSLDGKSVAQLKDAGNAAFRVARWTRAKEAYEWAVSTLDASSSRSAGDPIDLELLATLLSNLALTNVKLSLPHSALRAAQRGLSLLLHPAASSPPAPLRQKLLYRLSLAQSALERFSTALETLSPLLALDPPDPSASLLARRLAARLTEQRAGPSPAQLQALFSSAAREDDAPPDIADYFASSLVAVQPVAGRGNGLVAVAPIARGTLLACFKPLAAAGGAAAGRRGRQFNAGMNLWTRGMDPWAVGEVAAEVLWRAGWDELSGADVEGGEEGDAEEGGRSASRALRELWAGDAMRRLSNDAREGCGAVLDPSRAEAIVTFNGFHIEDLASPSSLPGASAPSDAEAAPESSSFHAPTALYPAPASALNHTCAPPTASYTFLRTLFLLRARVDLSPGDELTDAYVDAFDPLEVRADKLAKHGFVCACELCDEERAAGKQARGERERIVRELEGPAAGDPRAEVERVRRLKQEIEATYAVAPHSAGAGRGRVRPPLYAPARLLSQRLASLPGAREKERREAVRAELDALEALGSVFAPDEAGGWEEARMVHPPRVGDTNAVLSALFVARLWREMGRDEGSRHWIRVAREIEKGQAGVELFELRYGAWAKRQGLDLAAPAEASR